MVKKTTVHTRKQLKERRRKLRKSLTPAEAFLWKQLKAKSLEGKRFTKQHSIKNYIVDFYCAEKKLIVELDGEVHNNSTAMSYDSNRTEVLEDIGYTVLRFENKMVFENLASVLMEIKSNFRKSTKV
ncbi:MAG: endonuclease domain-containing protein [Flavobacteriaceae bacterium]